MSMTIDIETATDEELLAEFEQCQADWGKWSCDCFGFYITAMQKEISKRNIYNKMRTKINKQVNQIEPKRTNGFRVKFAEPCELQPWMVEAVQLPSLILTAGLATHNVYNGYSLADDIAMLLIDTIGPSTSHIVIEQTKSLFDMDIELLDPIGDVVGVWKCINCKIVSADFGVLDNESDIPLTIEVVVRPASVSLN